MEIDIKATSMVRYRLGSQNQVAVRKNKSTVRCRTGISAEIIISVLKEPLDEIITKIFDLNR